MPNEVVARVVAELCCRDKKHLRLVNKEMRAVVDYTRMRLSLQVQPWVTRAVMRGVASRFLSLEHLSLSAVPLGTLVEVPQLLLLRWRELELVCGQESRGERDTVPEGLAGATGLTWVTLRMSWEEDLGLLRGCTGIRRLEVVFGGPGPLDPDPLALSHMHSLRWLSCEGLAGPRALALLRGATSLTRLRITAVPGVSLVDQRPGAPPRAETPARADPRTAPAQGLLFGLPRSRLPGPTGARGPLLDYLPKHWSSCVGMRFWER